MDELIDWLTTLRYISAENIVRQINVCKKCKLNYKVEWPAHQHIKATSDCE